MNTPLVFPINPLMPPAAFAITWDASKARAYGHEPTIIVYKLNYSILCYEPKKISIRRKIVKGKLQSFTVDISKILEGIIVVY